MLTSAIKIGAVSPDWKKCLKVLLFLFSTLILLLPNILIAEKDGFITICLKVISKILQFWFLAFIVLRLTKSFFWAYLLPGAFYLLSSVIEIGNIILLNHYITADNIVSLVDASKSEVKEFYNLFHIYLVFPIILIICFLGFLKYYRSVVYSPRARKQLIPIAIICLACSIGISLYTDCSSAKVYSGKNLIKYTFRGDYLEQHPFNLLNESYVFVKNSLRTKRYKSQHDHFKFNVLNPKDTTRPGLVVFIIGERMRYRNWSVNGYQRETSPNLKNVKNLISFNRNYSNSNFTYGSIPFIITQATPNSQTIAYSQKTIVSLFKEAGYETSWISNQYLFDIIDDRKTPDHLYELYKGHHTDVDVIPLFDSILKCKSNKKRFIIINLLGGHGGVPSNFNVFSPNDSKEDYSVTMKNAPIFINTYDNIIRLQDYVISQIMELAEKNNTSSVVMFTADHGCNLFDNGKALFGYGSANPTENETHVPLFISMSDEYLKSNPGKYKYLLAHKNNVTTNNDLFYTLADLSHIKYHSYVKEKSIADSAYLEPSSRFVYAGGRVFEFKNSANPLNRRPVATSLVDRSKIQSDQ